MIRSLLAVSSRNNINMAIYSLLLNHFNDIGLVHQVWMIINNIVVVSSLFLFLPFLRSLVGECSSITSLVIIFNSFILSTANHLVLFLIHHLLSLSHQCVFELIYHQSINTIIIMIMLVVVIVTIGICW